MGTHWRSSFRAAALLVPLALGLAAGCQAAGGEASDFAQEGADMRPLFERYVERVSPGGLTYDAELHSKKLGPTDAIATTFPHGRSLKRRSTDAQNPRTVSALTIGQGARESVLIAHTPGDSQLEILAPTPRGDGNAGANEFLVVSDWRPGGKPSVFRPPVGLCTACHQGGAAIFADDPWSEAPINLQGVNFPGRITTTGAISVDPFVRRVTSEATPLEVARSACARACGTSYTCRKSLLAARLGKKVDPKVLAKALLEEGDFRYGLTGFEAKKLTELGDRIEDTNRAPYSFTWKRGQDPLFPRWPENSQALALDVATAMLKSPVCVLPGENAAALRSIDVESAAVAEAIGRTWPPTAKALQSASSKATNPQEAFERGAYGETDGPLTDPAVIFGARCAGCHATGMAPLIQFEEAASYNREPNKFRANPQRTPAFLIREGVMPPRDALPFRKGEKEILLRALGG